MLLKGAYCVGEHFVDPQCILYSTQPTQCTTQDATGSILRRVHTFVMTLAVWV